VEPLRVGFAGHCRQCPCCPHIFLNIYYFPNGKQARSLSATFYPNALRILTLRKDTSFLIACTFFYNFFLRFLKDSKSRA
jgi:hypothetical protein